MFMFRQLKKYSATISTLRAHKGKLYGNFRPLPRSTPIVQPSGPYLRWLLVPTAGFGIFGVFQWMYIKNRVIPDENDEIAPASNWEVTVYTLLPLRIFSRINGMLTSIDLPVFLRPKIYSAYAEAYGVNIDECKDQNLKNYRSLSEFFVRPLREECRPIDKNTHSVASPADGRILNFGKITSCQVDQVKGVTYSLQEFLGEPTWLEENENRLFKPFRFVSPDPVQYSNDQYLKKLKKNQENELYQCVVYLAPGDYHRFHSPINWTVNFRRYVRGHLLSVNPAIASWIQDLFSLNERAAYVGEWEHGFFSMTAVGATNVGSIKVVFDPALDTNNWDFWELRKKSGDLRLDGVINAQTRDSLTKGTGMTKGELFGEFRLGSTIVLIFEAPKDFKFNVQAGQKIKYGQRLGARPAEMS